VNILVSVRSKSDSSARNVTHSVNGRLFLGRSPDSVIPLDGPGISREHLAVDVEGSTVYVTDLSSNGTWLNGNRLPRNRKSRATETDALEIPGYEIRIQLVSDALPAGNNTAPVIAPGPVPALIAEQQHAPAARPSPGVIIKSLTALEKLLVFVAVLSFCLLLLYLAS
jgi:pSer/pThr/pTyr-binding forkhead associated (FHA) protein